MSTYEFSKKFERKYFFVTWHDEDVIMMKY